MDDIYSTNLLELAADIPHIGRLASPDCTAHKVSRICGSELTIDLNLENRRIADLGLEIKACALGQASASVFARNAIGASLEDVQAGHDSLKTMLKHGSAPPTGRFADLEILKPAEAYRQRHGSIMLIFNAALAAFDAELA